MGRDDCVEREEEAGIAGPTPTGFTARAFPLGRLIRTVNTHPLCFKEEKASLSLRKVIQVRRNGSSAIAMTLKSLLET